MKRIKLSVTMPDKTVVHRYTKIPYTHAVAHWHYVSGKGWTWSVASLHYHPTFAKLAANRLWGTISRNTDGQDVKVLPVNVELGKE